MLGPDVVGRVPVRRGGRVKAWSVPLRLVKAVQVCWVLVSWVTAWRFRRVELWRGRVRRGGQGVLR